MVLNKLYPAASLDLSEALGKIINVAGRGMQVLEMGEGNLTV